MIKGCGVFKMSDPKIILGSRELGGTAQKIFTGEVMRVMEPYMPKDEGHMINSMKSESGRITVNVPYARRRIISAKNSGLRGPDYFERMKADKRDYLVSVAEKATGGKVK